MKLRMFTRVGVTSATGKKRMRNVNAKRGCSSVGELVRRFEHNLKLVSDPKLRSIRIDVRCPPTDPELKEFENDEDGDFAWQHDAQLSAEVAEILKTKFPNLTVTVGHVGV
jgi:hypothetical protein